jgi:hypothetical protein
MKGRKRSTHNYLTPLFNKYNVKRAFIITLLILISSTAYAGLSGVKIIVISPSQLNKSGWLQVSEIIASQTGTGKDLALIQLARLLQAHQVTLKQRTPVI